MSQEQYSFLDELGLRNVIDNIKTMFAKSLHSHKLSDISDYTVDSQLSSTSENPVQNKVLDAEFNAISEALNIYDMALDDKASKEHVHEISEINELQKKLDTMLSYEEQILEESQKMQARENINAAVNITEDEVLEILIETDTLCAIADSDGCILTNESNEILLY